MVRVRVSIRVSLVSLLCTSILVVWTIMWRHLLNELLYILALCQYTAFDYTQDSSVVTVAGI